MTEAVNMRGNRWADHGGIRMVLHGAAFLCSFYMMVIAGKAEAVSLQIRGALIDATPCSINAGRQIDVDFGEGVGINKVDGIEYRQKIDYQVKCDEGARWNIGLAIYGPAASFDSATLQTSRENLGLRIYQNGKPFVLNKTIVINPKTPPLLEVVPIKKTGMTLTEGAFEVTATLRADYQ